MIDKEKSKEEIRQLIERFLRDRDKYKKMSETDIRNKLIDPLLEHLRWDVDGKIVADEVLREETVPQKEHKKKKADYTFRIGVTKLVMEAKSLKESLDNEEYIEQVIGYAYNIPCSWAVLTNFEIVKIFCVIEDTFSPFYKINLADINNFDDNFEMLWFISKHGIMNSLLDNEAKRRGIRKERTPVDKQLFNNLREWRDKLSGEVRDRYKSWSEDDIDETVQRIIDRLIFIRKIEDLEYEERRLEQIIKTSKNTYEDVKKLFHEFNKKYNSKLFGEKETDLALCDQISITDHTIEKIIWQMYRPSHGKPEYNFSVIDADVLGNIYEQYLSYILRKTPKGAKLKGGISHRKEQGIYYTPTYIVDYIVKNTLGELLKDKNMDKNKIRILDMSCGSGSFLLKTFDDINNYWEKRYGKDKSAKLDADSGYTRKVRILKNNIFGVDLDPKAIEIAQLNLLLKIAQKSERLPTLKNNIRVGNSLVDNEDVSINAFKWQDKFKEIMNEGGFDVIVGNPPWLMAGYHITPKEIDFLHKNYKSASGKFDLYYCFIEKALKLLSNAGIFGMIVPNKFFHTKSATELRKLLLKSGKIYKIVDFGDEKIFGDATNYSSILFLKHGHHKNITYVKMNSNLQIIREIQVDAKSLSNEGFYFEDTTERSIFQKIETCGIPLKDITKRFGTGAQTGSDKIFFITEDKLNEFSNERKIFRKILRGRDVRKYCISKTTKFSIFPYKVSDNKFKILDEVEIKKYKKVWQILEANKDILSKRVWFNKNATELSGKWYGFVYLDSYKSFIEPHILTPSLSNKSNFSLGTGDIFVTGTAGVTSIILDKIQEGIKYILGVLNSNLISFYVINHSPIFQGGYHKFSSNYLKKIPIRRINFSINADSEMHNSIIKLVDKILSLNIRLGEIGDKRTDERSMIEDKINELNYEINSLVYMIYGITENEKSVIEASLK